LWTFGKKYIPKPDPSYLSLATSLTSNKDYVFAGSSASLYYNLPGKVYIYRLEEPIMQFHQVIESGEGYWNDRFGINMLAKGDTLLVTAFFDSVGNSYPGSVYMFVLEDNFWVKKRKIVPSDPGQASLFGRSLAINDGMFFIGAPTSKNNNIFPGKVYICSSTPLSVFDEKMINMPNEFQVSQNFPNPFNSTTRVNYYLPTRGDIVIDVINNLGQRIIRNQILDQSDGDHSFDLNLDGYSSGVYFIKINYQYEIQDKIHNYVLIKKAVHIK
jgi:hypothetical protein